MAQRRGSVAGTVPHISVSSHAPTTACALVSEQRGMLAYWQIDKTHMFTLDSDPMQNTVPPQARLACRASLDQGNVCQ